jgi:hypothetical protein
VVGSKKNAGKIAVFAAVFGVALSAIGLVLTVGPTFHRSITAKRLLTTGMPAIATVLSLTDTGDRINMLPVMMINLHVTAADGTTFDSTAQEIVSPANLGALQAGQQVSVRYDPADRRLVAIVGASP